MIRALHALALVFVALAVTSTTACSAGLGDLELGDGPAPFTIIGPREGLVYTDADDEDELRAGIQLVLRVDVDDEAVEQVDLAMPAEGFSLTDVVAEDLSGRRAAFFEVTLDDTGSAGGEHEVVATSPDVLEAAARAVLVARPGASGATAEAAQ